MAKIFHYVIEVDEKGCISLTNDGDGLRFDDGNVFNEETEKWEKGWSNENEERDLEIIEHLTAFFDGHNILFGGGQELAKS